MALDFDSLRIKFLDGELGEFFVYWMGFDGGDDRTDPEEYMKKLITDDSLKEISKQLDSIRKIIWG